MFQSSEGSRGSAHIHDDEKQARAPSAIVESIRLQRPFWPSVVLASMGGICSGLATTYLPDTINQALQSEEQSTAAIPGGFIALAVLSVTRVSQQVIARLQKDISARIMCAAALATTLAGLLLNGYAQRTLLSDCEHVRSAQDDLQSQCRVITDGANELRLNWERRSHVYGTLLSRASDTIAVLRIRAMRRFWSPMQPAWACFFAGHRRDAGDARCTALQSCRDRRCRTVLVLLYIESAASQLAGALPMMTKAQVSLRRIAALGCAEQSGRNHRTPH